MAIKDHFEGKRDLGLIDPRKLKVDPDYNVRDLEKPEAREGLDYLKSLIRVTGVQTPMRIREEGVSEDGSPNLIIVRGHRRHKVVMELIEEGHPIKLVPVTQEPRGTTAAERNWDLIDSNSEEPLKGFERADALYRQIHTFGWDEKEILRRTGKTQQWLDQQLALRTVAPEAKQMVDAGQVSLTVARQTTKEHGAAAVEVLKKARAANPNKRVTPKAVAKVTGKSSKQKQATDSLLDFVSVANKIDDEAKRAGGVDRIEPARLVALANETVNTLAKAKGQRVEDATPLEAAIADAPAREAAISKTNTTPQEDRHPALVVLIEMTKQAHLCVQHNQSDDHPGWWSTALVEAIRNARDVVERMTGEPLELEILPDSTSQDVETATGGSSEAEAA
jgi:hypothetical protein